MNFITKERLDLRTNGETNEPALRRRKWLTIVYYIFWGLILRIDLFCYRPKLSNIQKKVLPGSAKKVSHKLSFRKFE